ncbi:hydrolase [Gracilibacillus halophilus YIM-C55.5]|uniref:Hydrolase n=1 Tax=Gracilibacillus halophilus YIM-C55.5 TaxID=1308866 RepID=N4W758_9BACI|nr:HAD family hydrolase [Gracilibacillus halophilus]ENH96058.1 hydrolase [Gracilibacillus halophilus YIM-C55.5]
MIKAAVFDLDGTLLNREASVKYFIQNQYERFCQWFPHVSKVQYVSRFIELDHHGYVSKDKVYPKLVDEFQITALAWTELLQDYTEEFKHCCVPFPNLIDMLEKLKQNHRKLGMITNGKGQFQQDNMIALGIENYFDTILISEWEGMKKPEPQIFKNALNNLGVLPSESMFVGDHPEKDIQAAQNVGMKTIWKKDDYWGNVVADSVVEDLGEIPTILEKLDERKRNC